MSTDSSETSTRDRMVAGAADLMRRRGVTATSFREVVRHTNTPRGSIGHHFPGGKQQLIEEALVYAGRQVGRPLEQLLQTQGAIAGLRAFIQWWGRLLQSNDFAVGCPVLAVAVDPYSSDQPDAEADRAGQERLLDVARDVIAQWQSIIAGALKRHAVPAARARRLAALAVASVEGGIALCRLERSTQPLDHIRQELEILFEAVIEERGSRR